MFVLSGYFDMNWTVHGVGNAHSFPAIPYQFGFRSSSIHLLCCCLSHELGDRCIHQAQSNNYAKSRLVLIQFRLIRILKHNNKTSFSTDCQRWIIIKPLLKNTRTPNIESSTSKTIVSALNAILLS